MNTNKTVLTILILVTLTMACQTLSRQITIIPKTPTPSSSNTPPMIDTPINNILETEDALTPERYDLINPGRPEDYANICNYGAALIPYPPISYDRDYSLMGKEPIKPNSYAVKDGWCDSKGNVDIPYYLITYSTTWGLDDIFAFYRNQFDKGGYIGLEPFPKVLLEGKYVNWSGFNDKYTIELFVWDPKKGDPNNPAYEGSFIITITLKFHSQ